MRHPGHTNIDSNHESESESESESIYLPTTQVDMPCKSSSLV